MKGQREKKKQKRKRREGKEMLEGVLMRGQEHTKSNLFDIAL